jgi:hypothetical protein
MLTCTRIHRAVSPRGLGSNLDLKADRSKGTLGAQQYNHNNIPSPLFLELSTVNNTSLISDLTAFRARPMLPYGHLVPSRLA